MSTRTARLEIIDGKAVQSLVEARAIRGATVLGQKGGWAVLVRYGALERAVAAQRAQIPRLFRNLTSAAAFVRDGLGLARFDVDARQHEPDTGARRRPDQAARMKARHEAAAHDAWFRAEVAKGPPAPTALTPNGSLERRSWPSSTRGSPAWREPAPEGLETQGDAEPVWALGRK
jgi:hypothetical protein